MKKKTPKTKVKLKRFLVSVTTEDMHEEVILARNEKAALRKFYKSGDGQYIDGHITEESVRKARRYE
jgi:hypothetical protein